MYTIPGTEVFLGCKKNLVGALSPPLSGNSVYISFVYVNIPGNFYYGKGYSGKTGPWKQFDIELGIGWKTLMKDRKTMRIIWLIPSLMWLLGFHVKSYHLKLYLRPGFYSRHHRYWVWRSVPIIQHLEGGWRIPSSMSSSTTCWVCDSLGYMQFCLKNK